MNQKNLSLSSRTRSPSASVKWTTRLAHHWIAMREGLGNELREVWLWEHHPRLNSFNLTCADLFACFSLSSPLFCWYPPGSKAINWAASGPAPFLKASLVTFFSWIGRVKLLLSSSFLAIKHQELSQSSNSVTALAPRLKWKTVREERYWAAYVWVAIALVEADRIRYWPLVSSGFH